MADDHLHKPVAVACEAERRKEQAGQAGRIACGLMQVIVDDQSIEGNRVGRWWRGGGQSSVAEE